MIEAHIFLAYSLGLIIFVTFAWMLYYITMQFLKDGRYWDIEIRAGTVIILALIVVLEVFIVLLLTGHVVLPEKIEMRNG